MSSNKSDHTRQCKAHKAASKRAERGRSREGDEKIIARGRKCRHPTHSGTRPARQPKPEVAAMSGPVAPPKPPKPPRPATRTERAPVPAVAPAPSPAPLRQAVAEWLGSWEGCGLLAMMTVGNWIIEFGTWDYLLGTTTFYGVSYGQWAAASVIAGEMAVGRPVMKNWIAGRQGTWTRCLVVIVVGFMALEAGVAYLRETAAIHRDREHAIQTGAAIRPAMTCKAETMPDSNAGHPESIKRWQEGADERLQAYKACLADQSAQQRESTGTLVKNAEDRNPLETWVLVLGAVVLSAATSVCGGTALSDFFHSLLGVRQVMDPAPVKVLARAPAPTPAPTPAPETAPEPRWKRVLLSPFRAFSRKRTATEGAA